MSKKRSFNDHLYLMKMALEEADLAYKADEVPIGAIVVDDQGSIISKAHNLKESVNDPCGHAELLAIREASQKLGDWRLNKMSLYVSLEPCPMCLGALIQARIGHLYFGAYDYKGGALSLGFDLFKDPRLNHRFSVTGGLMHYECSRILSQFFKQKRQFYKK